MYMYNATHRLAAGARDVDGVGQLGEVLRSLLVGRVDQPGQVHYGQAQGDGGHQLWMNVCERVCVL